MLLMGLLDLGGHSDYSVESAGMGTCSKAMSSLTSIETHSVGW